jgi:hypothetical protein
MSGWNWFSVAWKLSGERATELDNTFKLNFLHNLTIYAYLLDKADAERLEMERMKLIR